VCFIVMFLLCKHVRLTCVFNKLMMMMMMMIWCCKLVTLIATTCLLHLSPLTPIRPHLRC